MASPELKLAEVVLVTIAIGASTIYIILVHVNA